MRSLLDFVHFGLGVPGCGPTRARKSWVHSVKPLRYLLCKGVVSVWPEGTLGRTSPLRIRQTCPIFFHVILCPSRARRQKIVPFRVRMDFLRFSGPKTQKILPGRDATCVCCRISFILAVGGPGGAPHALPEVGCNPSNRSGTCCGRGWFRYGRMGPSVACLCFASAKRAHFFPCATVP